MATTDNPQQVPVEQAHNSDTSHENARASEDTTATRLERLRSRVPGASTVIRRFNHEIDRLFDDFFALGRKVELFGLDWETEWPAIEAYQRDGKFVVQLDAPGSSKDEIKVELKNNALWLSGERKREVEQNERGFYRSERSYGSFRRVVPLPQGARADTASASFDNGVLRVELEAPSPEDDKPRQIEVRGGPAH